MTFDINALEIRDTADWHVVDAKGSPQFDAKGNPITITLHSPGTKIASQAQFEHKEKTQNRLFAGMGGKADKRTEAEERAERADLLAKITHSLNGFTYQGGAAALYKNPKLRFIADGVDKFYSDMGNFAPESGSSLTSSSGTQPG